MDAAPDIEAEEQLGTSVDGRDLAGVASLGSRSLGPSAVVVLATVAAMLIALVPIYLWAANAAATLGFDDASQITPRRFTQLLLAILVPAGIVLALLAAALVGGAAIVAARVSQGLRPRPMSAFWTALRRCPRLLLALVVVLLGILAAFALTPFLVVAGVLGLVLTPLVRRLQRRRPGLPWPTLPMLVVLAIPFGLAAALVLRWALVLPIVALERGSIRGAFDRSAELTRPHLRRIAGVAVAFLVVPVVLLGVLNVNVLDGATSVVGPQLLSTIAGLLVLSLAIAAAAHLFAQFAEPVDLAFVETPPPGGTRSVGALLTIAVLAAAVPVGLSFQRPAEATPAGAATIVVNDLGDAPDADPGDPLCATEDGTCTLRAALDVAGASSDEVIGFAVSGTITVGSTLRIRSNLTIDGSGQRVTVSGGGTVGVFATAIEVFGGGTATLRALTIADGYDAGTGGGAIYNSSASGGEGLVLDGVTVRDTVTAPGAFFGGAVVNVSKLTVRNSTFSGNAADAGTDGSDLANLFSGRATISQSTFTGSSGSSAISSTADDPVDITNSVVTGPGFACSGTFTGSGNVTSDSSEICPGAFGATTGTLGLTALADNGGPTSTVRLSPTSVAIDAGDPTACASADQRGATRPKGGGCDAGAYELDPATATSLTVSPPTVGVGGTVTLDASVSTTVEPVVPTGQVEFFDGATSLGTAPLDGGSASKGVSSLGVGSHTLTARYVPDSKLAASTSAGKAVTVDRAPSTVTLTSSGSPTAGGEGVTFSVAVTASAGGVPSGTVTVRDGATTLKVLTLDPAGTGSFTTTTLAGGPHTIVADYAGDAGHAPASSAPLVHEVVGGSTTTLRAPAASTVFGNGAAFAVEVTGVGGHTPTGVVSLLRGSTLVGTGTLDATGKTTITVTDLPPGTNSVVATYEGDGFNGGSVSSAVTHSVTTASTSTALTVSPTPSSTYGGAVRVDIAVTAAGTPAVPGGIVAILDGSTVILNVGLNPDGTYSNTLPTLPAGPHDLRARYEGATGFATSSSPTVHHEVQAGNSSVSLSASSPASVRGELVTLTAQVGGPAGGGVPTGTVTFRDGVTELATVALDGTGKATLDTRAIAVGARNLTARYDGSADLSGATSSALVHTVSKASTTVAVSSSPTRSWYGSSVRIDVVVAAAAPGAGAPTGVVAIGDGASTLGSPTLDDSGRASITVATIAVGDRTLRADYAGDGGYLAASGTAAHTVDADATTVTVLTSEPDQRYGRPITFTAVVLGTGSIVPAGTVTFTGAGRTLGSAAIDASGRAEITVADLPVGSPIIQASYEGSGGFTAGSGVLVQQIAAGPTATSLVVTPSTPTVADLVTLTATVTAPGATLKPTGTVTFTDGGVTIATVAIDANGKATTSRLFDRSSHDLQARFTATTSWQGSASTVQTIVPTRASGILVVSATPSTALVGSTVVLRAAIPAEAGVADPTGVIQFSGPTGSLGSAPLVGGVASLSVTAPLVPGPWAVEAWYAGDAAHDPIAPTAATVTVHAAPTTVSVVSDPNPGFAASGAVTVRAHVASMFVGAPITGSVRFTSDSPVLDSQTAVVDASGFAEITLRDVPAGTWNLSATYQPAAGSAYAGSEGTTVHRSVKRAAAVAISGVTGLKAGRATTVTASVTDPAGSDVAPTGPIVVTAGSGITCTIASGSGSCDLVIPTAGAVTIRAAYAGDARFLPAERTYAATVTVATPTLRASTSTRTWVSGDPITIDWSLPASATGTVTVQSPFGVACTAPAASSGSCTTTVGFEQRGAAFDFTVAYSGDASWEPAYANVGGTLVGCYPVTLEALPAEGGTVTGPDGNCNGGAGFVAGTWVNAVATPAPGYVLARWLETDRTPVGYRFQVGEDAHSATALFQLDCVSLTYRSGQAPNVDPLGSANGSIQLSAPGDCGSTGQLDPATGTTTVEYRRGTTLQATATSSSATTGEFKGWAVADQYGNATYPVEPTIELTLDGDTDLTANFGARCYQPDLVADGPGTAEFSTAPNCLDATNGDGYVYGSQVAIEATPGEFHYVGSITNVAGLNVEPTAFNIRSDDPLTVAFDPCSKLTTAITGSGTGEVVPSDASTCPGREPGYYVPGEITLQATAKPGFEGYFGLPVEGDKFKRWIDEDGLPLTSDRANPLTLDMSQDRRITAVFTSTSRCATVTLKAGSPEWVGDLKVTQAAASECDGPNQYLQGQPFTLTASILKGAPLIQWQVTGVADYPQAAISGKSTKIPARTQFRPRSGSGSVDATKMYGDVTATAYVCTGIQAAATVVGVDGQVTEDPPPDGFIRYDSEPSCPGTGNGWLAGDTIGYVAGAQPVGYDFLRWDGDVPGKKQEGSVTLDGSRETLTLKSVYRAKCFTVTVTPADHTYRGLEPNCPGRQPDESTYVGGTTVALYASGGGEVWVGWEGDVDRGENPTWTYVDKDVSANAKWRDKTTNESVKEFFTDVGNGLAVGVKKLVGVGILAANALINTTVTTVLGVISLASAAIDAIAKAVGEPTDGTFREVMTGIQQTANLWSSPFSCGAEWAFAGAPTNGEGSSLDGTGGDWKDAIKDPSKLAKNINSYKDSIADIEDSSEGFAKMAKKFAVRANVAKSVGTLGLTAVGVGTSLAGDDMGWDDTASEAWGSEAGRAFFTCMEKAIPDYWGVPSLGFEDPS